ncbi:MAG: hypothetical protein ACYDDA_10075 [Acidiferrobacteraceae bacterium]
MNNCGIDPEGTFLTDFFGSVNAPNTGPLTGQLIDFDQYADTNNMIVLYPQTTSSYLGNPYGCWDWWGYLSAYDTSYPIQGGLQMQGIWNMVTQLGG